MKKAFSIIEIVFVILIIGILVTTATPKLILIKDKAKVISELANFKTFQKEINLFYGRYSKLPDSSISTKEFTSIKEMIWKNTNTLELIYFHTPCIQINMDNINSQMILIPLEKTNSKCKILQEALVENNFLDIIDNKITSKKLSFGGSIMYDISSFN